MNLPENYQSVMPYLILKQVAAFIQFSKDVFGAKELNAHKNPDESIMHAEIKIGESTIMMGESGNEWTVQNAGMFIYVENTDKTFQKAIDHGAEVIMPISDKEYGRTCGVRDPFGNTWWITQAPL
jgi:uncharacterized glyoxalase superfamily protein PhnB